jgi:hypothetical protein
MDWPRKPVVAGIPVAEGRTLLTERQILLELANAEALNRQRLTCTDACVDEVSCRSFLCACCRRRVLVCRRCDRGQIYCVGTCAQEARRERQRNARRRYQTTPRGRAMHAERNRRYRARVRRVTDHGPAMEHETGLLGRSEGSVALREPSSAGMPSGHNHCHHCGQSASPFLRLSALHPERRLGKKSQIKRGRLRIWPPTVRVP